MGRIILFLVIAILIAGGAYLGYEAYKKAHAGSPNELVLHGNVEVRQAELAFRASGRITELLKEEGEKVKKGETVARIDSDLLSAGFKQFDEKIVGITSQRDNLALKLKRRQELLLSDAVSLEEVTSLEAEMRTLEAQLREVQAARDESAIHLGDATLISPHDGIVISRLREVGDVVAPGAPVYTVTLPKPVWVRAYITEKNLGKVHPGQKVSVKTDIDGKAPYDAVVAFVSPVAEFTPKSIETEELRTDLVYLIRVNVPQPDEALLQGMPVTIRISL